MKREGYGEPTDVRDAVLDGQGGHKGHPARETRPGRCLVRMRSRGRW